MMKKISVNIISGFLGSGKTTAIIKLLGQKPANELWAVIINEFGKISIDSQTLRSNSDAGMIFDIPGGCICCSAKGHFRDNLDKIVKLGMFNRIIIEPSGLGGIEMVSEIVQATPLLGLMPVICLVDITTIENARLQVNQIYRRQILRADVIVFSKCDLVTDDVSEERLINRFYSLFPDKQHTLIIKGENLFPSLLAPQGNIQGSFLRMVSPANRSLTDKKYEEVNCLFGADKIFDTERLTLFFDRHPQTIRAKGHVQTDLGWKLFNFTLTGCLFESCEEKKQSEIVVIFEKSEANSYQDLKKEFEEAMIQFP